MADDSSGGLLGVDLVGFGRVGRCGWIPAGRRRFRGLCPWRGSGRVGLHLAADDGEGLHDVGQGGTRGKEGLGNALHIPAGEFRDLDASWVSVRQEYLYGLPSCLVHRILLLTLFSVPCLHPQIILQMADTTILQLSQQFHPAHSQPPESPFWPLLPLLVQMSTPPGRDTLQPLDKC